MRKLDKSKYTYTFVSGGIWNPEGKIRLITWNEQTGQHISRDVKTRKILSVTPL